MPGHTCCGQQGQVLGAGREGDRPELGLVVLQEGMEGKYTQRVKNCLPWGCSTLGRLAGGWSSHGSHPAKPAQIPCVSLSVEGRDSDPTLCESIESPLSSCLCHGWCICLLKLDLRIVLIFGHL